MNSMEKQKEDLYFFIQDLKCLAEQYGYSLDQAMDTIGFKPKTKEDLLLEQARELYSSGTWFKPLDKNRERCSNGEVEVLCDRIYARAGFKMFLVYEPTTNEWAKVINE